MSNNNGSNGILEAHKTAMTLIGEEIEVKRCPKFEKFGRNVGKFLKKAGAQERHESRIEAAYFHTLAEVYKAECENTDHEAALDPEIAHTQAWAALTANGIGTGGDMGLGGEGSRSARMPVLAGLGKGRRQASDGPAWDAAIKEASWIIGSGVKKLTHGGKVEGYSHHSYEWGCDGKYLCVKDIHTGRLLPVEDYIVPREWQITILKRGILQLEGLLPEEYEITIAEGEESTKWGEALEPLLEAEEEEEYNSSDEEWDHYNKSVAIREATSVKLS
jgi:hypothetical protein